MFATHPNILAAEREHHKRPTGRYTTSIILWGGMIDNIFTKLGIMKRWKPGTRCDLMLRHVEDDSCLGNVETWHMSEGLDTRSEC